jgi:hypothetical protein
MAGYVPDHEPFHVEPDGFKVWELANGHFAVSNVNNGNNYRGDLKGVARFIERERRNAR